MIHESLLFFIILNCTLLVNTNIIYNHPNNVYFSSINSNYYENLYKNSSKECLKNLKKKRSIENEIPCPFISDPLICNLSSKNKKYRSFDGSCNNLKIPFLGRSNFL